MTEPLPEHYTTAEVAASLNLSTYHLCELVRKGYASPMRTSGKSGAEMRWTKDDIATLKANLTPGPVVVVHRRGSRRRAAS